MIGTPARQLPAGNLVPLGGSSPARDEVAALEDARSGHDGDPFEEEDEV